MASMQSEISALFESRSEAIQRSNGTWLITHEHISLPVDIATGSASVDLVP